jgi:hypothetical protein
VFERGNSYTVLTHNRMHSLKTSGTEMKGKAIKKCEENYMHRDCIRKYQVNYVSNF